MNKLITIGVPSKVLPVSWKLFASDEIPTALVSYTDGYQIKSCMKWVPAGEESGAGMIGACVEALSASGDQLNDEETGHPVVCQLINVDGNSATSQPTLTSLSVE